MSARSSPGVPSAPTRLTNVALSGFHSFRTCAECGNRQGQTGGCFSRLYLSPILQRIRLGVLSSEFFNKSGWGCFHANSSKNPVGGALKNRAEVEPSQAAGSSGWPSAGSRNCSAWWAAGCFVGQRALLTCRLTLASSFCMLNLRGGRVDDDIDERDAALTIEDDSLVFGRALRTRGC